VKPTQKYVKICGITLVLMKENLEKTSGKGFSLIEILISVGIFAMLATIVYSTVLTLIRESRLYRENTTLSSIADQYLEIARNLPYAQVGTKSGNPHGALPDLANATTTTVNNTVYQMYYAVSYVDDPADGTALLGTDTAPNDYKQLKFYIKNTTTGVVSSFLSTVAPKGLESLSSGGALSIKVFDSLGVAVPYAIVNITNTAVSPNINVTRITDANGNWVEVGLPNSANSYHIVVTKSGDSTDQTYPVTGGNPNPTKPDATVLNGQVTQISFSIDKLSNLTLNTVDQSCAAVSETNIGLHGDKIIGTPNVLKFNNTYSSNASGNVTLNNIEWDSYTPSLTTTSHMLYGSLPVQSLALAPDTSQQLTLVYGPKTTNSLLVIVKDSATGNSIASTSIELKKGAYDVATTTSSGGACPLPGQAMFSNISSGSNYTATVNSEGYQTKIINGINISGNNLLQVLLNH
jgi:prepilin-type N-terminal cleavage/methylation domain-containing protein